MGQQIIAVVGLSHKTAPLDIRERIAFKKQDIDKNLEYLCSYDAIKGAVILSTCNRVEIYVSSQYESEIYHQIKTFLENKGQLGQNQLSQFLYYHHNKECVSHLLRVAAGLDSMAIGETEIFGQVKEAYIMSLQKGTTDKLLNKLFQYTFHVVKEIRSQTKIQLGNISIASLAAELAKKSFKDLSQRNALIIGAGEIGRKSARSLRSRGINRLYITNRTLERAQELANSLNAIIIDFEDWPQMLHEVNVVIFCAEVERPLLNKEMLLRLGITHSKENLLLIDIGVPRNVDKDVQSLQQVIFYNIDDLKTLTEQVKLQRLAEIDKCEAIIDRAADEFMMLVENSVVI